MFVLFYFHRFNFILFALNLCDSFYFISICLMSNIVTSFCLISLQIISFCFIQFVCSSAVWYTFFFCLISICFISIFMLFLFSICFFFWFPSFWSPSGLFVFLIFLNDMFHLITFCLIRILKFAFVWFCSSIFSFWPLYFLLLKFYSIPSFIWYFYC